MNFFQNLCVEKFFMMIYSTQKYNVPELFPNCLSRSPFQAKAKIAFDNRFQELSAGLLRKSRASELSLALIAKDRLAQLQFLLNIGNQTDREAAATYL